MARSNFKPLYLFLACFLVNACSNSDNWRKAIDVVPLVPLTAAAQSHTTNPKEAVKTAYALSFGDIKVVDFRQNSLCGDLGCIYVFIYQKSIKAEYLVPINNAKLFQSSGNCLIVRQPEAGFIRERHWCPNGDRLNLTENRLVR